MSTSTQGAKTTSKPLYKPHILWGEYLGEAKCPYARRWVVNLGFLSFRLHSWYKSDDSRFLHDHPWWFITIVLRGGYVDVSEEREDILKRGSIRFRPANHRHYVKVNPEGALTFLVTGAKIRKYGFWVDGQFVGVRKYFKKFGHPACD